LPAKLKTLHTKGQPVLLGTVSIEKNEALGALLTKARAYPAPGPERQE
jgi:preprotein translocase subunit SecA